MKLGIAVLSITSLVLSGCASLQARPNEPDQEEAQATIEELASDLEQLQVEIDQIERKRLAEADSSESINSLKILEFAETTQTKLTQV